MIKNSFVSLTPNGKKERASLKRNILEIMIKNHGKLEFLHILQTQPN